MLLDSILGLFSLDMGIDLGTCNTLVCVRGDGIVAACGATLRLGRLYASLKPQGCRRSRGTAGLAALSAGDANARGGGLAT